MVDSLTANTTCCRFHVNDILVTRTTGYEPRGKARRDEGLTFFFLIYRLSCPRVSDFDVKLHCLALTFVKKKKKKHYSNKLGLEGVSGTLRSLESEDIHSCFFSPIPVPFLFIPQAETGRMRYNIRKISLMT